mgnify:FL=1|tara:strand:- start:104 stop:316 length:213 start_codon:yes stop_codon:yes gene_type:complete
MCKVSQHGCDRCGEVTQRSHWQDDDNRFDAWDKNDTPVRICEVCHCEISGFEFGFLPEFWVAGQAPIKSF